ncbi:MAG: hypothetical protein EXS24_05585, partial [Pedosphaera sp.]|nr:hypothetical protein [Pedosphaera sp.]
PADLKDVVAISAGRWHNLALKKDGTVVGWGCALDDCSVVPAGVIDVVAIAAGGEHSVALKKDGTLVTWGSSGDGDSSNSYSGDGDGWDASGLKDVVAISAGLVWTVAIIIPSNKKVPGTATGGYNRLNLRWRTKIN